MKVPIISKGYVSQGFKSFFKEEYSHYFFLADDMILNPVIDENNYREHLSDNTCFISRLSTIDESKSFWAMNHHAIMYNIQSPGVEASGELPNYNHALDLLKKFWIVNRPLKFEYVWQKPETFQKWMKNIKKNKTVLTRYFFTCGPRYLAISQEK